jgi:uncharacterized membrane protein
MLWYGSKMQKTKNMENTKSFNNLFVFSLPFVVRSPQLLVYCFLLFLAVAWFTFSFMPAYWASSGEVLWAVIGRRYYSAACHQLPARCFTLWEQPLALCARCTGIYGGLILGLIIYPFVRSIERTDLPARSFLLLAIGPTAIDFLLGLFNFVENTHLSRCATGAIAGAGLAFYLVPASICLARDIRRVFK